jgi:quinol monooxygenase YgiN
MAFVRITIARPRPEVRVDVQQYFRELIEATSSMPGFVRAYLVESGGASGEVGRVTIWESQELANRAAHDGRVMAIHSRLVPDNPEHIRDWDLQATMVVEGKAENSPV